MLRAFFLFFEKKISKIASKEIFDPKLAYTVIKIRVSLSYDLTIANSTEHRLQTELFRERARFEPTNKSNKL